MRSGELSRLIRAVAVTVVASTVLTACGASPESVFIPTLLPDRVPATTSATPSPTPTATRSAAALPAVTASPTAAATTAAATTAPPTRTATPTRTAAPTTAPPTTAPPTPSPTQATGGYPASLPNDNPCPAFTGANCYTFVVTNAAGAPLQGVCVVAGASSTDPSAVGCPKAHYGTDATGTAKIGTLGGTAATFFFLYPGKTTLKLDVAGSGTRGVQMP